ncbi:MAG: site-2 protease family protein [Deltaproteobacteria bacterium]|jgi:membrane-associated protease RseP (regulator of RpoE activity)|nr:site-2 protease family protein [Deltaproteobacteria bacterium]
MMIPLFFFMDRRHDRIPFINILLFLLTLLTTLSAGTLQQGINPLEDPRSLWRGLPFSFTLLMILAAHEFGHYFMAKKHRIDVTLPYFIPAPSFIGTFGAFIKMKSPMLDRRMLLDVGAAGPLAGMIIAVPVLLMGLMLSEIKPGVAETGLSLGSSLFFSLMSWIVHGCLPDEVNLVLHPIAFSGWIGLLVTCMNLLPVGQLDGGHVAYAIFGSRQRIVARIVVAVLLVLGLTGWSGWLVWVAILLFMGISHPRVVYEWIPLDNTRKVIGWVTLTIFVMTFTPSPF